MLFVPAKMDEKPHDNIPTQTNIPSPSSPVVSGKDKDKDKDIYTDTNIQPVIAEATQPMVEVRPEEQQIVPVLDKNEETRIDLMTTKSTSIEEAKPTSTSLMSANPEQSNQISLYGEGHTTTDENENVNSMLGGYFNPFLVGMAMWKAWLNMCSEFAAIGAKLSI